MPAATPEVMTSWRARPPVPAEGSAPPLGVMTGGDAGCIDPAGGAGDAGAGAAGVGAGDAGPGEDRRAPLDPFSPGSLRTGAPKRSLRSA